LKIVDLAATLALLAKNAIRVNAGATMIPSLTGWTETRKIAVPVESNAELTKCACLVSASVMMVAH
jgi:hypothetical protein